MKLSRREFFKLGGTASALVATGAPLTSVAAAAPLSSEVKWTEETATICPYCAVGCGIIVGTRDGQVVNTEGDPDHPINQGALCSKGSALKEWSIPIAGLPNQCIGLLMPLSGRR